MPISSLVDYRPQCDHKSPAWGGARRKAQRDSWREHNHSHHVHPAQSVYCDQRGNVRKLTDFDYTFKPRVHERLVRDLAEICTHPLGGVHPHTAVLIEDLAASHPNYDRLRNEPAFVNHERGSAGRMDMLRDANLHVADHMMLDWSGQPPSPGLPRDGDPLAKVPSDKRSEAEAEAEAGHETSPGSESSIVAGGERELVLSSSSPELRHRSDLALEIKSSNGISPRAEKWKQTPAAERYDRQTICASWSQAQLHEFGTSVCFGPAAMGLSGNARRRQRRRGARGNGSTEYNARTARPTKSQNRRRARVTAPTYVQDTSAPTREQLMADEQYAYNAWCSADLARPGHRPNLAMQKHQLQFKMQQKHMEEPRHELSMVTLNATDLEDDDEATELVAAEVSRARVQEWNESSQRREQEHLRQLGWPTQPGTPEYKAQELKLFSDRQQRKTDWTLKRSRAKVAACAKASGHQARSAGWRPGRTTSQGVVLKLDKEAQTLVDIEAKNEKKKFDIVRQALIESEGVIPSDLEVRAVLESIQEGKSHLSPNSVKK